MNRDPFTHAYLLWELWAYGAPGAPGAPALGPVALPWVRVDGRGLDDYLNLNMRQETPVVPALSVDGALSMSLTWMIVQALTGAAPDRPITDIAFWGRVFAALGRPWSPAPST